MSEDSKQSAIPEKTAASPKTPASFLSLPQELLGEIAAEVAVPSDGDLANGSAVYAPNWEIGDHQSLALAVPGYLPLARSYNPALAGRQASQAAEKFLTASCTEPSVRLQSLLQQTKSLQLPVVPPAHSPKTMEAWAQALNRTFELTPRLEQLETFTDTRAAYNLGAHRLEFQLLKHLTSVSLRGIGHTEGGLGQLLSLLPANLVKLDLGHYTLGDPSVDTLAILRFTALQELTLGTCEPQIWRQNSFPPFDLPQLRVFNLGGNSFFTPEALCHMVSQCDKLRSLQLSSFFTQPGELHESVLPNSLQKLKHLRFSGPSSLLERQAPLRLPFAGLPSLVRLEVDEPGMHARRLGHVPFSRLPRLTEIAFPQAEHMPSLLFAKLSTYQSHALKAAFSPIRLNEWAIDARPAKSLVVGAMAASCFAKFAKETMKFYSILEQDLGAVDKVVKFIGLSAAVTIMTHLLLWHCDRLADPHGWYRFKAAHPTMRFTR